jgi:fibronectin-binding autotransporter adhesin
MSTVHHKRVLGQDLPSCAGRHCSGQGMAGLALLVTIALLAGDAVGQTTNYWAPTSGAGGTGTWDTTQALWAPNADGSGTKALWNNALTNNVARFGGTAGTVTTGTAVLANRLSFDTTGYVLAMSGAGTVTLNGSSPEISLASGVAAEISANLAGTAGLSTSGGGGSVLTLSGSSTTSGQSTTFGAGAVVIATGGSYSGRFLLRAVAQGWHHARR